jgi:hypothetical protein
MYITYIYKILPVIFYGRINLSLTFQKEHERVWEQSAENNVWNYEK